MTVNDILETCNYIIERLFPETNSLLYSNMMKARQNKLLITAEYYEIYKGV